MAGQRAAGGRGSVTINTVARRAGVSAATVSRVINGIATVDEALAERVRTAAAEVGYRPSAVAQGLARGTLRTLGVIVPNLGNPFFYPIVKALEGNARRNDYRVLVADSNDDAEEEFAICEWMAKQVDSLILCSPRMPSAQLLRVTELAGDIVMVNRREDDVPIASVAIDSHDAMSLLGAHLRELGHRRVVYLSGPERSWAARDRLRSLMVQDGLDVAAVGCGSTIDDGYRVVPTALDLEPTAIVAFNDLVAFGALSRLRELRVDIPGDISLAGFDDIPFSAYVDPPLTSITYPDELMGTTAWNLVSQPSADRAEPSTTFIKAELVARGSTGPARPARARLRRLQNGDAPVDEQDGAGHEGRVR